MKSAIFGAGAMGTVLGAYLARNNEKVDLINRNVNHIQGLKTHGAQIIGKATFTQKVNALLPNEMKSKYDIIFLMTKQNHNQQVVKDLLPFLETDGVICTMQNGMPELIISSIIGEHRTYGCTMEWGATLIGNGKVELTSEETRKTLSFNLGAYHPTTDPHFKEIYRLLSIMGHVRIEENFIGARWSKLLVNSALSGLSAIFGASFGEVAKNKTSRRIVQLAMKECIDVAKKAKIKIEPIQGKDVVKIFYYHHPIKQWLSFMLIPIAMKNHYNIRASMLQDLQQGKKCEIEAINGVIATYGKQLGINTPINDRIIKIVQDIENHQIEIGWSNLSLFKDTFHL